MLTKLSHPALVDGVIILLIASLTNLSMGLSSDDAYKYVNPYLLFYMKLSCGTLAAGLTAVNGFRNKQIYSRPEPPKPTNP